MGDDVGADVVVVGIGAAVVVVVVVFVETAAVVVVGTVAVVVVSSESSWHERRLAPLAYMISPVPPAARFN